MLTRIHTFIFCTKSNFLSCTTWPELLVNKSYCRPPFI